jgi:hypothetical protein
MIDHSTGTYLYSGTSRTAGYGHKPAPAAEKAAATFDSYVQEAKEPEAPETKTVSAFRHDERTAGVSHSAAVSDGGGTGSFLDFIKTVIDIINPLQHIPVISTIYRHITGDEISPAARVAGDALFGGPIGAAVALADLATQSATGRDMGGNVMAMLSDDDAPATAKEPPVMMASAQDMNNIAPAAGGVVYAEKDIIWDAPVAAGTAVASLVPDTAGSTPRSLHTDPAGFEPSAPPSLQTAQLNGSSTQNNLLRPQSAPVVTGRTPERPGLIASPKPLQTPAPDLVPPNLISQKMMEGLDKYAAMKKAQHAAPVGGKISATF